MPSIYIDFTNNYGIYIFVYFFLPFLFFYKTKIINFTDENMLSFSYDTSNQLKGVFIVIVILHHISQHMGNYGLMKIFHFTGLLAVGAFFFISGVGLTQSLKRNHKYLHGFLHKKIARLYLPFIIINIFTIMVLSINGTVFTYTEIIKYSLSVELIDTTLWFIITIMIFYLFFFISFKNNYNIKALVVVTILVLAYILVYKFLDKGSWTYISSLCFLLGIYYVFFENKIHSIIYNNFNIILLLSISTFIINLLLYKMHILVFVTSYMHPVFFIIFVTIIFIKIKPQSFIFNFIGVISLEIYLLHMKLLLVFSYMTGLNSGLWIVAYLSSLIIFAFVFSKINAFIYSKLLRLMNRIN